MTERRTALLRALRPVDGHPAGALWWEYPSRSRETIFVGAAEFAYPVNCPSRGHLDGILLKSAMWPINRLSEVRPVWAGKPVIILAGGPSLTQQDVSRTEIARKEGSTRVIAVNDAYLWAPWADVMYASDSSWWLDHERGIAKPMIRMTAAQVAERFEAFEGERCSIQDAGGAAAVDPRIHILRNARVNPRGEGIHADGLSLEPDALITGRNSGWQAMNLAALAGSSSLILLGFDGRPAADGRSHWSGGHREPTPQEAYSCYRQAFSTGADALKKAGIPVFNCSQGTAYDCFPKADFAETLAALTKLS